MFLVFMAVTTVGGISLVFWRRRTLVPESAIASVWTREAFILLSAVLLVLLALVTTGGTLIVPISKLLFDHQITVGPAFYNNVLIPTGLLLLLTMAMAPVLQWGRPPSPEQNFAIRIAAACSIVAAAIGFAFGLRSPIALAVIAIASLAIVNLVVTWAMDARRTAEPDRVPAVVRVIQGNRRLYAGFLIHVGFVCLAIGVTGSSLGTRRIETVLSEGESIEWAERTIHYERLVQRELSDRLVAEAVLHVSTASGPRTTLRPARHLHLLQNEWTTEVAIDSTWRGDFYTVLNSGEGDGRVSLTLVSNPLMRFLWLGAGVMVVGAIASLWPMPYRTTLGNRRRRRAATVPSRRQQLAASH
jgi:cytochrome c-type biogenesis protein CcmF